MGFAEAVRACFSKYVTFSGRASRSEFWWFAVFVFATSIVLSIVDSILFGETVVTETGFSAQTNTAILTGIFFLAVFLPYLSVAVRRLHDTDRSGWWYWIALVPIVGTILLIVWFATKGTDGGNRFGGNDTGDDDDLTAQSSVPTVDRD